MEEQSKHLQNLIRQKNSILSDISLLENNLKIKKELSLKIQGAIEYLNQIGVSIETDNIEKDVSEDIKNAET